MQTSLNFVKNMSKIPSQMSVFFGRRILKTVNFFEKKFTRIDAGKKNPAAARTEINRDIKWTCHRHRL
jgi:hypothetical protein